MTLHEYEGWQLSVFKEPTDPAAGALFLEVFNNQWLRQVVYRYLAIMNISGMMMLNSGVFHMVGGTSWLSMSYDVVCMLTGLLMLFGSKKKANPDYGMPNPGWATDCFKVHGLAHFIAFYLWATTKAVLTGIALTPNVSVPVGFMGVMTCICGGAASWSLLSTYFSKGTWEYGKHQVLVLFGVGFLWPVLLVLGTYAAASFGALAAAFWVPPALMLLGGVTEANFAERVADQWMHAAAVFWMMCGYTAILCFI